MSRHLAAVVAMACALVTVVAHPGAAAGGQLHAQDLVGDANGTNSQRIGLDVPNTSTAPASVSGADIVALDVVTRYRTVNGKRVAKGTLITLSLAGPVQPGVQFTVTATSSAPCDGRNKAIQLIYQDLVHVRANLTVCKDPGSNVEDKSLGYVEANTAKGEIVWLLERGLAPGQTLSNFVVESSGIGFGVLDELRPKGTFSYAR